MLRLLWKSGRDEELEERLDDERRNIEKHSLLKTFDSDLLLLLVVENIWFDLFLLIFKRAA